MLHIYCDTYPDLCKPSEYIYETREELLFDLVNKGVSMRKALSLMHLARKGKKLTEEYVDVIHRFEDGWMKELSKIIYLPSLCECLQEVLDVNKLI